MSGFDLARFDTRDDWLLARWGIGASEIATVVGLNRYESALTLWAKKVGVIEPEPDNLRMAFGRRIEGIVLDLFAEQTGLLVARCELAVARSRAHSWAFCSPDGFVFESAVPHARGDVENALGVVEAKSTSQRVDFDDPADVRAASWIAQVQWQLFVTGLDFGWVAVLDSFRDEVRVEPVPRDEQAIEWLFEEAERFWSLVERRERPHVDAHPESLRLVPKLWPAAVDAEQEIEPELARALLDARRDERRIAQRVAELRAQVIEALWLDDNTIAEYATAGGQRVVRYKQTHDLDVDRIIAEHPEALDEFTVTRFDSAAWAKANKKLAADYRTVDGKRPFVVLDVDEDAS